MELENNAVTAMVKASRDVNVVDKQTFEQAKTFITDIVTLKKQVCEYWDPLVKKAHATWKETIAKRKQFLEPLEEIEGNLRPRIALYLDRQRSEIESRNKAIAEEAAKLNLPAIEISVPKDEAITTRSVTKWEVTSLQDLVAAVARGDVPIEAVQANDEFIRKMVTAMGENLPYPGIRVYKEQVLVVK